jgi:hypothetical protein
LLRKTADTLKTSLKYIAIVLAVWDITIQLEQKDLASHLRPIIVYWLTRRQNIDPYIFLNFTDAVASGEAMCGPQQLF